MLTPSNPLALFSSFIILTTSSLASQQSTDPSATTTKLSTRSSPSPVAKFGVYIPGPGFHHDDDPDEQYGKFQSIDKFNCWTGTSGQLVFKTGFAIPSENGSLPLPKWVMAYNNVTYLDYGGKPKPYNKKDGCYLQWWNDKAKKGKEVWYSRSEPNYPVNYCLLHNVDWRATFLKIESFHLAGLGDGFGEHKFSRILQIGCYVNKRYDYGPMINWTSNSGFHDTVMYLDSADAKLPTPPDFWKPPADYIDVPGGPDEGVSYTPGMVQLY